MSVLAAIAAHRTIVEADEALFSDTFECLVSADEADASQAACHAAYRVMLAEPCVSIDDVHAKVDYLLNGTVGERTENVSDLTGFEADDGDMYAPDGNLMTFLRSLAPNEKDRV